MDKLVSIIIRTKNEERWIRFCLERILDQSYKNFEIVIVDNLSTDGTLDIARQFDITIVEIDEFLPGKAINLGIERSTGDYIVCLSAHCIPVSNDWLKNLIRELDDESVAGVYGRQEPLSFSSPIDKRDLAMVFGLDKKVQKKDPLFHNANSAFRRSIWDQFPFDATVTNIEDRLWGKQVIDSDYTLIYEPAASVYHWHGIHHELDKERAEKIVSIMERHGHISPPNLFESYQPLNAVALVPIKGKPSIWNQIDCLERLAASVEDSLNVKRVVCAVDNDIAAEQASRLGLDFILRPQELSNEYISIPDVLAYIVGSHPEIFASIDYVVLLEETYPCRPRGLVDEMLRFCSEHRFDELIACRKETRYVWKDRDDYSRFTPEESMPSAIKVTAAQIALNGLCTVYKASSLRGELGLRSKGLYEVNDFVSSCDLKIFKSLGELGTSLIELWDQDPN